MTARQGRVTAEVYFHCRRKPAQVKIDVAAGLRHQKSGFGKIVLGGDGGQHVVLGPAIQRAYRGRVAGEDTVGKGVDLMQFNFHRHVSQRHLVVENNIDAAVLLALVLDLGNAHGTDFTGGF